MTRAVAQNLQSIPRSALVVLLLPLLLQATSENYKQYAERLASWGFAVVQYDFLKLSPWIDGLCHSDAAEVSDSLSEPQSGSHSHTNHSHAGSKACVSLVVAKKDMDFTPPASDCLSGTSCHAISAERTA